MILLDTNAALFLHLGMPISLAAQHAAIEAAEQGALAFSSVSAWEIANLVRKGRIDMSAFLSDLDAWLNRFTALRAIRLVPLTADMAIESGRLPGAFHDDPGDRLLVATARTLKVPLMTRDRRILDYAEAGHLRTIAC
jgi:PIN domain nuclease of toxin-antitoxin system